MKMWATGSLMAGILALVATCPAQGQSFVNFESPQIHPIDVTPDGSMVLVANTADNRLEILDRSLEGQLKVQSAVSGRMNE